MSTASRVESEEMEEFISNLFLSPKEEKVKGSQKEKEASISYIHPFTFSIILMI